VTAILTKQHKSVGINPAPGSSLGTTAATARVPLVAVSLPEADVARSTMVLMLTLILGAAAILRLRGLGDGLWYDEIDTLVHYVRLPLAQIMSTFDNKNQHVLYSVLAHWSTGMFGDGAWALRLPAAVFGVASIGALAWFGALVTSRLEALAAAALLAFSYHHVWFSQNARGYTGLMLATLVASGLLVKITTESKWRPGLAIAYGITMGLALYIHMTAALILAGHAIWWCGLAIARRRQPVWPAAWSPPVGFVLAVFLALILYMPVLPRLLPTLLAPSMGGVTAEWRNPVWFVSETIQGLARGLPGGWLTFGPAVTVTLIGLWGYVRRRPAIAWLMLLPVFVTGAALFVAEQNLWPRFFFFAAGFGALIVMHGVFAVARVLWRTRVRELGFAGAVVLVMASASTVPWAWGPKQDFLAARNFIESATRPGDAIVTVDMTEVPFNDYYGRQWPLAVSRDQLAAIESGHSRTFVVLTFPVRVAAVHPDLWAYVQKNYRKAAEFRGSIAGGEIIVMAR
jgi:mannosyltransferase